MGVDVYGKMATSERGSYFRNNWWYWRPLWAFVQEVAGELVADVDGDNNSGQGLDGAGSATLSEILLKRYYDGTAKRWQDERQAKLDALPQVECHVCEGLGKTKKLGHDEMTTCTICGGAGKVDDWQTSYPFDVENVKDFAEFLADCGGFQIC
jgi:DnaJ-class molecular chaperone